MTTISPPLPRYFNPPQWILYTVVVITGVALRWFWLDLRPIHHDESLHMMYSLYFWERPDSGYYRYDPMLHGPLLYNFMTAIYYTFGISLISSRVPMAFLGTILIFVPLLFRRYFSPKALLTLSTAIAFSPSLIYWTRFLREDSFVVMALWLTLLGIAIIPSRYKAFVVGLGVTMQFCSKENAYMNLAILCGYLLFEFAFEMLSRWRGSSDSPYQEKDSTLLHQLWSYLVNYPREVAFSFIICSFFYVCLYTSAFRHLSSDNPRGFVDTYFGVILDALWRKSVGYWLGQHEIERIKGPFLFQFYTLSWYELAFIGAVFLQVIVVFKQAWPLMRLSLGTAVLLALLACLFHFSFPLEETRVWDFFKLKSDSDLFALVILLCYSPTLTVYHLVRRERLLAFWGYTFTAVFFSYSFVGEKVPWLALYPLLAGFIYLALFFDNHFKLSPLRNAGRIPVGTLVQYLALLALVLSFLFFCEEEETQRSTKVIFCSGLVLLAFAAVTKRLALFGSVSVPNLAFIMLAAFTFRVAILVNYVFPGAASEFISQVHTTNDFHNIALRLQGEIETYGKGYKPKILALEDPTWPMGAYMMGYSEYQFAAPEEERKNFDYIFTSFSESPPPVPAGFHREKINLRGWWLPEWEQMTLKNFLHYAINHIPWSPSGYTYCFFLTREEGRELHRNE